MYNRKRIQTQKHTKLSALLLAAVLSTAFSANAVSAQPLSENDLTAADRTKLTVLRDRLAELEIAMIDQQAVIAYTEEQVNALEADLKSSEEQIEHYKAAFVGSAVSELNQTVLDEYEAYHTSTEETLNTRKASLQEEEQTASDLRDEINTVNDEITDLTTLDGSDVVKYALQFEGNPYVYGGTSLTNGTDCSGFIMSLYKNFGKEVGRSSYDQEKAGTEVSYDEMLPGDIICYSGHVALYMGNGQIIHAKDSASGIVIEDNPQYMPILTIRRIFND